MFITEREGGGSEREAEREVERVCVFFDGQPRDVGINGGSHGVETPQFLSQLTWSIPQDMA